MKFNKIILWGASSQSLIAEKMINEGMCFIDKVVLQKPKISYLVDPFIDEPKNKKVPLIKDKKKFESIIYSIPYFLVCIGGHHGMARTTISTPSRASSSLIVASNPSTEWFGKYFLLTPSMTTDS